MTVMVKDTFELLDDAGRSLAGYMVSSGPAAVVLVHEVFGLNEQIRNVARRVAGEGFTAFRPPATWRTASTWRSS